MEANTILLFVCLQLLYSSYMYMYQQRMTT